MIVLSAASAHAIPLRDGTVHAVVTSPPYYSLRSYIGDQAIEWPAVSYAPMPGLEPVEVAPMVSALGLEPTPEAYIAHLVLCFREVRRVLRDDGVAWCVMGSSYAARDSGAVKQGNDMMIPHRLAFALQADGWVMRGDCIFSKVAPMPESVSGWHWKRHKIKVEGTRCERGFPQEGDHYVPHGSEITDRPLAQWVDCPGCPKCSPNGGYVLRRGSWRHTRAHETVLMLTKGTGYFCDQEKVREAHTTEKPRRIPAGGMAPVDKYGPDGKNIDGRRRGNRLADAYAGGPPGNPAGRNPRDVLTADELDELWSMFLAWLDDDNPPDVLTPRPESYKKNHYAVYPASLITPLIRASCPTRCCPECGAAWAPVVERESSWQDRKAAGADSGSLVIGHNAEHGNGMSHDLDAKHHQVLGYRPTCDHDANAIPGTILDPFVGSGTTLAVARELGLNAIGLDLSPSYLDEHAKVRVGRTPSRALETLPLFQEVNE